ncbi:hypothetical protein TNCV_1740991 [Trichonephila clavipes]|uniref:Uncharacterized protein n=1 Tax=Trichonephila clavipes TaxID=2585209 RepID=A0A8X6RGK9_TRICX|nr:hypothetical protein TNCV_1740991 [Trichonephila clavipes]
MVKLLDSSMWICADWGFMVFSDESRFQLSPYDKRRSLWKRPEQNGAPELTIASHALIYASPHDSLQVIRRDSSSFSDNHLPQNTVAGHARGIDSRPKRQYGGKVSFKKFEVVIKKQMSEEQLFGVLSWQLKVGPIVYSRLYTIDTSMQIGVHTSIDTFVEV